MNTPFSDIYKLFLGSLRDYRLQNMFMHDPKSGDDMLKTYLLRAIPKFFNCEKDIKTVDSDNSTFLCELDLEEQVILAQFMVLAWYDQEINDIRKIDIHLSDSSFKHTSEGENLKQKSEYVDRLREKAYYDLRTYGYRTTDFSKWGEGDYGV